MDDYDILIRQNMENFAQLSIKLGTVTVDDKEDFEEFIGFIKAGIEAYQDWKVNGDE